MRKFLSVIAACLFVTSAFAENVTPAVPNLLIPGPIGTTTPAAIKGTTIWQSGRNAYTNFVGLTPAAVTSTSRVMLGMGSTITLTPSFSGRVRMTICGYGSNNNATGVNSRLNIAYGTGTAPVNGAVIGGGTVFNTQETFFWADATVAVTIPFCVTSEAHGLTLSAAYWFDMSAFSPSGGAVTVVMTSVTVEEF